MCLSFHFMCNTESAAKKAKLPSFINCPEPWGEDTKRLNSLISNYKLGTKLPRNQFHNINLTNMKLSTIGPELCLFNCLQELNLCGNPIRDLTGPQSLNLPLTLEKLTLNATG